MNANARVIGFIRLVLGLAVLFEAATVLPRLWTLTEPGMLRAPYIGSTEPISAPVAAVITVAWLIGSAGLALGVATLGAALLTAAAMASVLALDAQLYSNHAYLMATLCVLVGVGGGGRSLSLDSLRTSEAETTPRWALAAIRIQISIVYVFAALSKLNPEFLSGTVLTHFLRPDGPLALPVEWRTFELMAVVSITAVLIELLIGVGLWMRRWRRMAISAGLLLHLGMVLWGSQPYQLAIFAMVMFAGYLAFVAPARQSVTVVWDDSCGFCEGWVRWFRRLDWLDAVRLVPLSSLPVAGLMVDPIAAAHAMHAVANGSTSAGFRAVIRVVSVLPATFLAAGLLGLPFIRTVGDRTYEAVARRRTCSLPPPETRGAVP